MSRMTAADPLRDLDALEILRERRRQTVLGGPRLWSDHDIDICLRALATAQREIQIMDRRLRRLEGESSLVSEFGSDGQAV